MVMEKDLRPRSCPWPLRIFVMRATWRRSPMASFTGRSQKALVQCPALNRFPKKRGGNWWTTSGRSRRDRRHNAILEPRDISRAIDNRDGASCDAFIGEINSEFVTYRAARLEIREQRILD